MLMKRLKKKALLMTTIVLASSTVLACGNRVPASDEGGKAPAALKVDTNETFTIKFHNSSGSSEEYFRTNTEPFMKKLFPNVTFEYINSGKGTTINDMIVSGTIPDIMLLNTGQLVNYNKLELLADLTPLAKENNVDLTRFDDNMMGTIKQMSSGLQSALPWSYLPLSLYYNKSIFDKFGVPYPKDGMTWDEVADLARKLSRTENGVKYRGFDMARTSYVLINQLSLAYIDPKTHKSIINTDAWKNMFTTFGDLYRIPGNELPQPDPGVNTTFFKDLNVAMTVNSGNFPSLSAELAKAWENLDLVTLPVFKSAPGTGTQYGGNVLAVSKSSKWKNQAMMMIAAATSDEAQKHGAGIARYPTVKNKDVLNQFGSGSPQLASKNVKSLQQLKLAAPATSSPYDQAALSIVTGTFNEIAKGTVDVVTALREADEKINKKIAEEKEKEKAK
jgi:multiple sugar transport system substrate-binding protein